MSDANSITDTEEILDAESPSGQKDEVEPTSSKEA